MSEAERIAKSTLDFLHQYDPRITYNAKTNVVKYGRASMFLGQFGEFIEELNNKRKSLKHRKCMIFIDKQTIIKSQANVVMNAAMQAEHNGSKHCKKKLLYTEIVNEFPFYIFDNLEEPRKYKRGYDIKFSNKDTSWSLEAEEFYNECDKHKLNQILYCIHKNIKLINEHRWTLQTFSRVAYVAMCTYYDREWTDDDLYINSNIYSVDSMIFSVLICKAFTARCGFYNIVDHFDEEWDWPEHEKEVCECPADCRNLAVTHAWRNRWDNDYLLDLTPKEAKTYWKMNEIDTTMDD